MSRGRLTCFEKAIAHNLAAPLPTRLPSTLPVLNSSLFCSRDGWLLANDIAPGGQLTTTSDVEIRELPWIPGRHHGSGAYGLVPYQSLWFGTCTTIFTETVNKVNFSSSPFKIFADSKTVLANSVIVATGAVAKRLSFPDSGDGQVGFWNRGISA
ncbi:hypothetical protein V6N13_146009 [Hibiscus sabdariffa]|uniref:Uncharacterized protein n=1 Tax=Hibiscus sabdariffa TaxID=183260 RepID=A0ABR2TRV3_9ROSI